MRASAGWRVMMGDDVMPASIMTRTTTAPVTSTNIRKPVTRSRLHSAMAVVWGIDPGYDSVLLSKYCLPPALCARGHWHRLRNGT